MDIFRSLDGSFSFLRDAAQLLKCYLLLILWRDRMGVPSKCTIVRVIEVRQRRSEGVVVGGRKTKKQNPKPKTNTMRRRST